MEKTIDFQLSEKLKYSHKGDYAETATIIMHPPSMDVFEQVSNLSQLVLGAVADIQERNAGRQEDFKELIEEKRKQKEDDEEITTPDEIKVMLFASQKVKFVKVADEFKKLAPSVCEVATGVKLVPSHINKMSINDYTNLICSYIANFITPSLL